MVTGCTTDVTRSMHYGTPTALQVEVYTRLLMGCIDLASTIFPAGKTMDQLEAILRRPLYQLGLDYGHGSTHGIGSFLAVHEEPGYYRTNEFGMRLENIVMVVRANVSGTTDSDTTYLTFEPVTLVPYETKLIDFTMLSSKQVGIFDQYKCRFNEWSNVYLSLHIFLFE
ncbi:hypothetical protein PR048_029885 [Dryococelus australis]|uniref:Uncharacterized protein n=1 Tax=Dryococelus australis TaxID=614101 RepID=A0ABQ9G7E8_9NEOP|nr:hypothetical protein PR048_029885 [Dryococelus australis]